MTLVGNVYRSGLVISIPGFIKKHSREELETILRKFKLSTRSFNGVICIIFIVFHEIII